MTKIRKVYELGDEFIDLTLIELRVRTQGNDTYHRMKCRTCGKEHILRARDFDRKCCTPKKPKKLTHDLTNQTFHQWRVVNLANPNSPGQHKEWNCVAICCGDTKVRSMRDIRRHTSPCKCQLEASAADKAERYKHYDYSHPKHLNPKNYYPHVREFIDYDYIHKLNDEEKAWLARFTAEYYGSMMDVKAKNRLHTTKDQLQNLSDMKVQGRRDIYNQCTRYSISPWGLELDDESLETLIDAHLVFIRAKIQSKALHKAA